MQEEGKRILKEAKHEVERMTINDKYVFTDNTLEQYGAESQQYIHKK